MGRCCVVICAASSAYSLSSYQLGGWKVLLVALVRSLSGGANGRAGQERDREMRFRVLAFATLGLRPFQAHRYPSRVTPSKSRSDSS
jgi:uncharacterized membrane protein YjjP (DUF1212 family)